MLFVFFAKALFVFLHALFELEPVGLFVADPLHDVVEGAYRTHRRAQVLDVDMAPELDVRRAGVEEGVVARAVGDQDLVVAVDLAEYRQLIAHDLILGHAHQRERRVGGIERELDVVTREEPAVEDHRVRLLRIQFRTDQSLDARVLDTGIALQEGRSHDAPAGELLGVECAALEHADTRLSRVETPVELFGHHQPEVELQRVGGFEFVVIGTDAHLGGALACGDGHRVGEQPVVEAFDGGAALVDHLHAERAVVVTRAGRRYGDGEIVLVLQYHVQGDRVGEHDVLRVGIGRVLLLAARGQGGAESRGKKECYDLFHGLLAMCLPIVAFIGRDFRSRGLQLMLRDGPYEERIAGLDLQVVALLLGVGLGRALESQAPALEVLQAEALHVELADALLGEGLHVGVPVAREVDRAARDEARLAQGFEVLLRQHDVRVGLAAVGFGTDQVLLGQTQRFGHRHVEDVHRDEDAAVAVVFDEQRVVHTARVADRDAAFGVCEVGRTHVVVVIGVEHPLRGDVVGVEVGVVAVEVEEHRAERAAVGGARESDAPDHLRAHVVGPHVFERRGAVGCSLLNRGELEGVLFVVDQLARVGDGRLPVLHVEGHAGADGLHGGLGHVVVVRRLFRVFEPLLGPDEVIHDELVGVVERGAADGFRLEILRTEHDTLLLGGRCGIVGLAEALDEFRVTEGADGVDLAGVLLEDLEVRVAGLVGHHLVDPVEVEVAAADHGVELCIDGFEFEVRGTDVPQPEVTVGVRVALHGLDQVALDVGQQGEQAAVE